MARCAFGVKASVEALPWDRLETSEVPKENGKIDKIGPGRNFGLHMHFFCIFGSASCIFRPPPPAFRRQDALKTAKIGQRALKWPKVGQKAFKKKRPKFDLGVAISRRGEARGPEEDRGSKVNSGGGVLCV